MSLPPHKWGGAPFLPPIFQTHGGGTHPPIFPDHGGRNRHNLWGGRFFCQMAEMGGCRFLVSPPHNYGGETVHPPHNCAAGEKFSGVSPPYMGGNADFSPNYASSWGCAPPHIGWGGDVSPPYFQTMGGESFSPPHISRPWGGTAPPHIFLDMGGYRHLWLNCVCLRGKGTSSSCRWQKYTFSGTRV